VLSCNQKEGKKKYRCFSMTHCKKKTSNHCLSGYSNFGRHRFYPKIVLCLFKTIKTSFQSFIQHLKYVIQLFKTILVDCFRQFPSYNYCLFYSNFIPFCSQNTIKLLESPNTTNIKYNSCCFTDFTLLFLLQIE
jgi:hypothetical protein